MWLEDGLSPGFSRSSSSCCSVRAEAITTTPSGSPLPVCSFLSRCRTAEPRSEPELFSFLSTLVWPALFLYFSFYISASNWRGHEFICERVSGRAREGVSERASEGTSEGVKEGVSE